MVVLNVLTRTSNRPAYFNRLRRDLSRQKYDKRAHTLNWLICTDDIKSYTYLKGSDNVICVAKKKAKTNPFHCPYNTYIQMLLSNVVEGWIMIVDDDAKLLNERYLDKLFRVLEQETPDKLLLQPIYFLKDKQLVRGGHPSNILKHELDMGNMIFHHSHTSKLTIGEMCQGDQLIYIQLLDFTTPKNIDIDVGLWANYHGFAYGKPPGEVNKSIKVVLVVVGIVILVWLRTLFVVSYR